MSKIKLTDVVIDPAVAIREGTDEDTIQRYMDTVDELPPIIVYQTDHKYLLADGFHRWAAATRKGISEIEAEVRQGTYEEASEYAIYANLKHGKPLSREEYKTALRRLQMLHPDWGQPKLARALGRSERFVENVIEANHVRQVLPPHGGDIDDATLVEIHRLDKSLWSDVGQVVIEQDLTRDLTSQLVREIKAEPERIVEILAIPPPELREVEDSQHADIAKLSLIFPKVNTYFANLTTFHVRYKLTKDILRPHAQTIYTWRDSVNNLINILEG